MHNNYEIVRVEEDRIFISTIDDYYDVFSQGYEEKAKLPDFPSHGSPPKNPKLGCIVEQLMNKLKADITLLEDPPESEMQVVGANGVKKNKIEICEKGSKRIIFGNNKIWKEVVVFVRSSMGGGGVGGGAFYFCLIDYNEHIPNQDEITGVSNSFLFSI
jgi:hypothetical protein